MADLFLSYASEDEARARTMAAALAEHGWSVFWDRTISAGQTWRGVIGTELEQARAVVVLWSKISVNKHWVIEEADRALKKKHLIPVMIDDVAQPLGFGGVQAAELFNWDGSRQSPDFQKLVKDIERLLGASAQGGHPAAIIPSAQPTVEASVAARSDSSPIDAIAAPSTPPPKTRSLLRLDYAIVAVVVATAVGGLWYFNEHRQIKPTEGTGSDVSIDGTETARTGPSTESTAGENTREKIQHLLARADSALEANRLSRPAGDNALEYFRAVLALDPDDSTAQRGLDRIVEAYIALAKRAYEENDSARTEDYLQQAIRIQPDNVQAQRLMKLNERLKAASARPANGLKLASISPDLRRPLDGADAVTIKLGLDYRLTSAERALLIVGSHLYPHSAGGCTGQPRNTRKASRVPITAQAREVSVTLSHQPYPEGGYLSFYAYFWDADAFDRGEKVLIDEFKEFNDYCYEISPRAAAIDTGTTGRTVLLGTWSWDIESDLMTSGTRADVWWQQDSTSERYLSPRNGAQLALLGNVDFDAVDLDTLRRARYSDRKLSGSDNDPVLTYGSVIALKTAEGNYAKIKVLRYRSSHDFNFKEAENLKSAWRDMISGRPPIRNYHLEIQWTLFKS